MKTLDPIQINVTQEAIDTAEHKTCCSCPIANSINSPLSWRDFPRIEAASVHPDCGYFTYVQEGSEHSVYRFDLPPEVREFVAAWDSGGQCKPFRFEIQPEFVRTKGCPRSSLG